MTRIWRIVNRGPRANRTTFAIARPRTSQPQVHFASGRPVTIVGPHVFVAEGPWESGAGDDLTIRDAADETQLFRAFDTDGFDSDRLRRAATHGPSNGFQLRAEFERTIADEWSPARRFFAMLSERDRATPFAAVLDRMVAFLGERVVDRAAYARHGLRAGAIRSGHDFPFRDDALASIQLLQTTAQDAFGTGDAADAALGRAVEAFVSGQLASLQESTRPGTTSAPSDEILTVHGAPNSGLFLYFAELLLLADDLRITNRRRMLPWLRTFVRTAHAFVDLYWSHTWRSLSAYEWRHRSPSAGSYPWERSRPRYADMSWIELEEDFSRLCLFALADSMRRTRPFQPHWL